MTIFFIWLGTTTLPAPYLRTLNECNQHHGKCQLIGTDDETALLAEYRFSNENLNLEQRSHLLRLLVL
jgi:hypothetical protein